MGECCEEERRHTFLRVLLLQEASVEFATALGRHSQRRLLSTRWFNPFRTCLGFTRACQLMIACGACASRWRRVDSLHAIASSGNRSRRYAAQFPGAY